MDFCECSHQAGFSSTLISDENKFRQLYHVIYPKLAEVLDSVDEYLHAMANTLQIPATQLNMLHHQATFFEPREQGVEYHLNEEKHLFDAITVGYAQAARSGLWHEAGVLLTRYPYVLIATIGLGIMCLIGVISIRAIRGRLSRETGTNCRTMPSPVGSSVGDPISIRPVRRWPRYSRHVL
jgi:hypothetical protein